MFKTVTIELIGNQTREWKILIAISQFQTISIRLTFVSFGGEI